jgi:hypothetical protein
MVWDDYNRASPKREAAGWFQSNNAAGIFNPVMGAGHSIPVGSDGRPLWPTGDGSVRGINSGGGIVWLFPGLKFRTRGVLVLGVIAQRGLVCLSGTGSLIYVDGPTVDIH